MSDKFDPELPVSHCLYKGVDRLEVKDFRLRLMDLDYTDSFPYVATIVGSNGNERSETFTKGGNSFFNDAGAFQLVNAVPAVAALDWTKPIQFADTDGSLLEFVGTIEPDVCGYTHVVFMRNASNFFRRKADGTTSNGGTRVINTPPPPQTVTHTYGVARHPVHGLSVLEFDSDNNCSFRLVSGREIIFFKAEDATDAGWHWQAPTELTVPKATA